MTKYFSIFLILFWCSCSGIKPIKSKQEQFSPEFRTQIELIKRDIKSTRYAAATRRLSLLDENKLSEIEKAEKYNLLGLISFNQEQYARAKEYFIRAMAFDFNEPELVNQLALNVASSSYKLNQYEECRKQIETINAEHLNSRDYKKVYLLRYVIAKRFNDEEKQTDALIGILSHSDFEANLVDDKYYKILKNRVLLLDQSSQMYLLDRHVDKKKSLVLLALAKDLLQKYSSTDPATARKLAGWIKDHYNESTGPELSDFSRDIIRVHEEIDLKKVGVVLPLTGDNSKFSNRIIEGMSLALRKLNEPYQLVIKNSQNSPGIASEKVRELIENDHVSFVIGGLFNQTAEAEYKQARRKGVVFISLSPLFLQREYKNELLFELPGSIESQVNALFSPQMAQTVGSNVAFFYPSNQMGESYLNEIWDSIGSKGFNLVAAGSYPADSTDYRDAVGNLVGLKYQREREEEYQLWEDIYKAKYKNIDRIQVLQPVVDFDWVFIPSYPQQALQIIPSFHYMGVKRVPFVGGPSWRSRSLVSRTKMLGHLLFVSDLNDSVKEEFRDIFKNEYNEEPKLMETLGFDAIYLGRHLFPGSDVSDRSAFNKALIDKSEVMSFLGAWSKSNQLWLKKMEVKKITSDGILVF